MSNSEEALKEKELGNAAYKKRNFEEALAHYRKGLELDPTDMRFILNEAAVLYEQKNYEECAKTALKAVEVGRNNRADYKLIAKAFSRAALAYRQDEKTYNLAKKYYESSLAEHRTPETKAKLSEVEKLIKEKIEREYRDPEKAEQERARGNELFKEGRYPEAIKAYTESIKRNPDEAKTYSNRAACYNKLTEYDLGLRDCNKCIELDSQFVKGHVRKGMLLKAKGQFEKALECFQRALELDEHNAEALNGYKEAMMAIDSDPAAVQRRALNDPEVQDIMSDPGMREILNQMRDDPRAAKVHLDNPDVARKVQKLVQSGILAFR